MPNLGAAVSTTLSRRQKRGKILLLKISCNPLISLDLNERIQGNPRKSKPHIRGFSQRNGDQPRKSKRIDRTAIQKEPGRLQRDAKRSRPPNWGRLGSGAATLWNRSKPT